MKKLLLFLALCGIQLSLAQSGTVSGTLTDENNMPLPGATILIKGTTTGTATDFDGKYTLQCNVGDILEVAYVGYDTREIHVTKALMNPGFIPLITKKVGHIENTAYSEAITQKDSVNTRHLAPSFSYNYHHNQNHAYYYSLNNIRDLKINENTIELSPFKPEYSYEIGYSHTTSLQFIKNQNLHQLQTTYAQGRPNNGVLTWFGPETNAPFSWGPRLNQQTYDNAIFQQAINDQHHLYFTTTKEYNDLFTIGFNTSRRSDVFNTEKNRFNKIYLNLKKKDWSLSAQHTSNINNQPNLNGFQNLIIRNAMITPPSFSNAQGTTITNESQGSFAPSEVNNPLWLLENSNNYIKTKHTTIAGKYNVDLSEDIELKNQISGQYQSIHQHFGIPKYYIGHLNGYQSDKTFKTYRIHTINTLNIEPDLYWDDFELEFNSTLTNNFDKLNYSLKERTNFLDNQFINAGTSRTQLHKNRKYTGLWANTASLEYHNGLGLELSNSSFISSQFRTEGFLPGVNLYFTPTSIFYDLQGDFLGFFNIVFNYKTNIKDIPLYHSNQSHNSLQFTPQQLNGFLANQDLFLNNNVTPEESKHYELSLGSRLFKNHVSIDASLYKTTTANAIFPIAGSSGYQLNNVAKITNTGFEGEISITPFRWTKFRWTTALSYAQNQPIVNQLFTPNSSLAIAGFNNIHNTLIEGEVAGVLVGSAYARNENNEILINNDSYPIVANTPKIIGNPNPDFTMKFNTDLSYGNWKLSFDIDYQKGGDVWNGTQNTLNYYGVSQESADLRNTTNFVFQGVNSNGAPNNTAVNFHDPSNSIQENRWVRYGHTGVAEDAIVDGTYVNLKNISLSYHNKKFDEHSNWFTAVEITLYAHNLLTYTKFRGASPYSTLLDHGSATGMHYFNTPLTTETGIKISLKI